MSDQIKERVYCKYDEKGVIHAYCFFRNQKDLSSFANSVKIPYDIHKNDVYGGYDCEWKGANAYELLHQLNDDGRYTKVLAQPMGICNLMFKKLDMCAEIPTKAHASDAGYDVTLIGIEKTVGNVTFYKTGLSVEPSHGYYVEIVPRSSISKTGYILANSVGIIDASYRGELLVALMKIDPEAKELELPKKMVQLIPRYNIYTDVTSVDDICETMRNMGGFGSTNKS